MTTFTSTPISLKASGAMLTEKDGLAITDALKTESAVRNKFKKVSDGLIASGITSAMLARPKRGEESKYQALIDRVDHYVLASFTATEQKIFAQPVKSLSDEQKVTRRFVQTEMGSRYGRIRRHLAKAEAELEESDNGKTPRAPRTAKEKVQAHIDDAIRIIRAMEDPSFNVTDALSALSKARAIVH